MARETKDFRFELKAGSLSEDGSFIGLASTYGNVDQGDDVVEPGAFTKTIQERGEEFPLLWSHDPKIPIGSGTVSDSPAGLVIKGQLDLDIEEGRRVYSGLKKRYIKGLSIGFDTIKRTVKEGIRHLTELKLYEVSPCVFPMNEQAGIADVKSSEAKDDFLVELDEAQTWAFRYMAMGALSESLEEILSDADIDDVGKSAQSSASIQQFHDKYLEMLPKMTALLAERRSEYGYFAKPGAEAKVGRRVSAATRKRVEDIVTQLQALLAEAADTSTSSDGAAEKSTEPDALHSWDIKTFCDEWKAGLRAA